MKKPNISRRDFLRLGGLSAAWATLMSCTVSEDLVETLQAQPTSGGLPTPGGSGDPTIPPSPGAPAEPTTQASNIGESFTETDNEDLILHTLRRMYFGFTPAMLENAREMDLENLLEEQLNSEYLDDSRSEEIVQGLEYLHKSPQQLFEVEQQGQIVGQFVLATLARQVLSPRQIHEMMVDFWSNHFNIFVADGFTRVLKIFDDNQVIRPNALATFSELLQASAHSPAMLVYLDQAVSTRRAPNENYARELLELHTVGVDGGYTHQDIDEAARTFTGWSVVSPRYAGRFFLELGDFQFRPRAHDDGQKTVMGLDIPAGSGVEGGEELLSYLAEHPSTARFISDNLATRFVADEPPISIIERLAETFTNNHGDIKSLLRTLVTSPEFIASARSKFKRPLEFFASTLIATEAEITMRRLPLRNLTQVLRTMGQVPHFWPTPDGYPDYADWWTTTSGMLARWNFALKITSGEMPGVQVPLKRLTADGQSPADVVDLLSLQFLGELLPDQPRDLMVSYGSDGDLEENIPHIAGLILGSPYFQMR